MAGLEDFIRSSLLLGTLVSGYFIGKNYIVRLVDSSLKNNTKNDDCE